MVPNIECVSPACLALRLKPLLSFKDLFLSNKLEWTQMYNYGHKLTVR